MGNGGYWFKIDLIVWKLIRNRNNIEDYIGLK